MLVSAKIFLHEDDQLTSTLKLGSIEVVVSVLVRQCCRVSRQDQLCLQIATVLSSTLTHC